MAVAFRRLPEDRKQPGKVAPLPALQVDKLDFRFPQVRQAVIQGIQIVSVVIRKVQLLPEVGMGRLTVRKPGCIQNNHGLSPSPYSSWKDS